MNLIIIQDQDALANGQYRLADDRAEHIIKILKAEIGDSLEVGLLNGPIGSGVVRSLEAGEVVLDCAFMEQPQKNILNINIICALPRPQTLKKVLHTAAAMGVASLYFIRSARVEKSYFHSPMLQPQNYNRFLLEGLTQGKNTKLPKVSFHDRFKSFMLDTLPEIDSKKQYRKLVFAPDAKYNLLQSNIKSNQPIILAIGPEGGWVPFEMELMAEIGFEPVTLGPWILRVENALTAALAQLELAK